MRAHELRVGRTYAYPTTPGPWFRAAVPTRVMSRGPRDHVLVLLPDGVPATATRPEYPRASLVWVDADALVSSWDEWPAHAASARADLSAVVASAVAAIGGQDPPTLDDPRPRRAAPRWWSRPISELLRPPPLVLTAPSSGSHRPRSLVRAASNPGRRGQVRLLLTDSRKTARLGRCPRRRTSRTRCAVPRCA